MIGKCKYCGQAYASDIDIKDEEKANEIATEHCGCEGTVTNRKIDRVKRLIKESTDEEVAEILISNIPAVMTEKVGELVIKSSGGGYKAKLSLTSKGKLKFTKAVSYSTGMEA